MPRSSPEIPRPPRVPRDLGPSDGAGVPPPSRKTTAFAYRLADYQVRRPFVPLIAALALTIASITLALRLRVLSGFEFLLPETRPSVVELHRVAARTAGVSVLFIVLQGGEHTTTANLRKAADALVPELEKLGPPWVGSAEDGVQEAARFIAPRAGLYADLPRLQKLKQDVDTRFAWEVAKASGTLLDEEAPPDLSPHAIRDTLGLRDDDLRRYPDGYYQSQDGKTVVVTVRSKVLGSDFAKGSEALRRIREVVDRVRPASFDPEIRYGFAGDLQTGISEYTAIDRDLREVGWFGAALITGVVFLYFLRLRTLLAMVVTIAAGVAWTFGVTELVIGHLNMATGFLFTIVAGNGINFGIIYMARFLEARGRGASLLDGVRIAHRDTWLPTLTAGCAAAASYGSLLVTEFRGFRDFGLIGSVGMVLCWIGTYLVLPPLLAVMERVAPLHAESGPLARVRRITQGGVAFGKPFAALAPKAPLAVAAIGCALGLVGLGATVLYVRADPMEYDLANLRNDPRARAGEIALTHLAEQITGYVGADGMAILVDRVDQVAPLKKALEARRDAAPEGKKPFKAVIALEDFVPRDQAAKIPLLLAIRDKVMHARKHHMIPDADWAKIKDLMPPDDLRPFGMADLPVGIARTFTETDGTRGRIVFISPISSDAVDDAHYLFRWADAYRETKLPDGSVVRGSGRAVIYADMWAAILDDVPLAVVFSFAATVLVVIAAFRGGRASLAVIGALLVGVGWMAGLLVLLHVKLQFLNFIALPITFGIGVDYAVNIVARYVREGAGTAAFAVRETGGAVILCSLTTSLGYLALVRSMNHAVRSLGVAAVLGEVSCLLAAVVVLPAALMLIDKGVPEGSESRLSLPSFRPSRAPKE
ncbi:MAG TPA: MMPL family transporter [Minicystis sp.]|nr:MMPL family transporter [Minicystis sp.]